MKPVLECPDPFKRMKERVDDKHYTQLCHIVLELETYMLEQKKLPTDFDNSVDNLRSALNPEFIFGGKGQHVPLPPQDMYVVNNPNVDQVNGNYDLESRLQSMEARQDDAIKHMNKAIS